MADPPRYPAPDGDPPSTPRWVKVFGIIALLVVLLILGLLLTRRPGGHGPQRHLSSGDAGGQALLATTEPYALRGRGSG